MNVSGVIIAAACFLVIGIFHPIVIKAEYHFSAGRLFWRRGSRPLRPAPRWSM